MSFPAKCPLCGQSFARSSGGAAALNAHLKGDHGLDRDEAFCLTGDAMSEPVDGVVQDDQGYWM